VSTVSEERKDKEAGRGEKHASLEALCYAQTISWSTDQNGNSCNTVHEICTALLLMISDSDKRMYKLKEVKISYIFATSSAALGTEFLCN
jgi:hypothetical protein